MTISILGSSYKGDLVLDSSGKPTGVTNVTTATVMDGAIGGFTGLLDGGSSFMTGTAKTVGELVKVGASVMATSKFTTGGFIPRRTQ